MKALFLALFFVSISAFGLSNQGFLDLKDPVAMTVTATSTQALPVNTYRRYLIIQNQGNPGTPSVFVKFDSAHSGTEGLEIVAGGNYEMLTPPYNAVYLVAATSTQSVVIQEGR